MIRIIRELVKIPLYLDKHILLHNLLNESNCLNSLIFDKVVNSLKVAILSSSSIQNSLTEFLLLF